MSGINITLACHDLGVPIFLQWFLLIQAHRSHSKANKGPSFYTALLHPATKNTATYLPLHWEQSIYREMAVAAVTHRVEEMILFCERGLFQVFCSKCNLMSSQHCHSLGGDGVSLRQTAGYSLGKWMCNSNFWVLLRTPESNKLFQDVLSAKTYCTKKHVRFLTRLLLTKSSSSSIVSSCSCPSNH